MVAAGNSPISCQLRWLRFVALAISAVPVALSSPRGQLVAQESVAGISDDDEVDANRRDKAGEIKRPPSGISEASFDRLLFEDRSSAAVARSNLDKLLQKKVNAANQICGLSDAARRKLELAAYGDIKLLFDRIDELRTKVCYLDTDATDQALDWNNAVSRKIEGLRSAVKSDLFGYGSRFDKALRHTLSFEQLVRYKRWESSTRHLP